MDIPPAPGEGPAGRRGNGLASREWGALVDLDPRLSAGLLDRLAAARVAAYVEPAGGSADPVSRSTTLPSRPLDRLFVDPGRADTARTVITEEVADLTGQDGDGVTGLVQAVPRTADVRVLPPPPLPGPAPAAPSAPTTPTDDDDEAWRQILEAWEREDDNPVPPWPVSEDVDDPPRRRALRDDPLRRRPDRPRPPAPPTGAGPSSPPPGPMPRRRRTDPPADEPGLPGWVEPEALDDEGHYVPPPAPKAPRVQPRTLGGVAAVLLGVLLLVSPDTVGMGSSGGTVLLAMLLMLGGTGTLVWGVRETRDDGPDDGAVV